MFRLLQLQIGRHAAIHLIEMAYTFCSSHFCNSTRTFYIMTSVDAKSTNSTHLLQ